MRQVSHSFYLLLSCLCFWAAFLPVGVQAQVGVPRFGVIHLPPEPAADDKGWRMVNSHDPSPFKEIQEILRKQDEAKKEADKLMDKMGINPDVKKKPPAEGIGDIGGLGTVGSSEAPAGGLGIVGGGNSTETTPIGGVGGLGKVGKE